MIGRFPVIVNSHDFQKSSLLTSYIFIVHRSVETADPDGDENRSAASFLQRHVCRNVFMLLMPAACT